MELGIIGLARSGKTSLFNAVTRGSALVGEYSSGREPNVGVVHVPDERVDAMTAIFEPKRKVYAEIRWVDFPVAGFGVEGPGAQFLAQLSELDALVHVVRAFEDASVPHNEGSVDAARDLEALDLELTFADVALIERRVSRLESEMRSLRVGERVEQERQLAIMRRMQSHLESGAGLRSMEFTASEERELRNYRFVTLLPTLVVVNIDEDQLADAASIEVRFSEQYGGDAVEVATLSAKVEAELAQMQPEEAAEFRSDLGLPPDSPLDRTIHAAYRLLGLHSFLTVGDDECRAWPVQVGTTAPAAAGKIHSDLERGFIRAEVANWTDIVEAGSLAALRRAGKLRTEGKSYVVQDGDVLNILFNV